MIFKDKEKALDQVYAAVENEVHYQAQLWSGSQITDALPSIMAAAITMGIRKAIEVQYSDDDFEQDLTLKP